jgi:hypothetical protein
MQWLRRYDLVFDAPCAAGQAVYAVHATDQGGPAALIATVDHCGHDSVRDRGVLSLVGLP